MFIGLLTRACEKTCETLSRPRHPFADADPRRRFLSAVGALTETSLRPLTSLCVVSGHRRVGSMPPDQLPGHPPYDACRGSNPKT
jgi:hypothetical protein